MEYIYATLLIHKAGGEVTEANVKKVLEAAGVKADDARLRALAAALDGVNIEEAIRNAAAAPVGAAAPAAAGGAAPAAKAEEKKEEKNEEAAAEGLGSLFG